MKVQDFNPFPHASPDSVDGISRRARRSRMSACALAAVLAVGLPLLQIAPAATGEVLEVPQVVAIPSPAAAHPHKAHSHRRRHRMVDPYEAARSSNADWTAVTPMEATAGTSDPAPRPAAVAANSESYPPDPNVGSISDYQNQPGEDGRPPSFAMRGGGGRYEPQGSMTANLIIGGILVGMVALEIASAHHHHR
jgi:hypothetical protein